jgi:HSP20 family protein
MALVRWRPMRDMMNVQDEMNRLFDRFFGKELWDEDEQLSQMNWFPVVDIKENKDEFAIFAELPGMKKEDVHITFSDGKLVIEGERKKEQEEKEANYHRVERSYGKFCRTFQLPSGIQANKIAADFKDGILKIKLPKSEEVKPKEIEVKVS